MGNCCFFFLNFHHTYLNRWGSEHILSWDSLWLCVFAPGFQLVLWSPGPDGMGELTSMDGRAVRQEMGQWAVASLPNTCPWPAPSSFQVQCADHDSDGSHDLIGTLETTLAQMQTAGAGSLVSFLSAPANSVQNSGFQTPFLILTSHVHFQLFPPNVNIFVCVFVLLNQHLERIKSDVGIIFPFFGFCYHF